MDLSRIERYFRLFFGPLVLLAVGVLLSQVTPGGQGGMAAAMLAGVAQALRPLSWVLMGVGSVWLAWNLWQLGRWEAGERDGGCVHCGGPVRHLSGRYGNYSKCVMCGGKMEGWR